MTSPRIVRAGNVQTPERIGQTAEMLRKSPRIPGPNTYRGFLGAIKQKFATLTGTGRLIGAHQAMNGFEYEQYSSFATAGNYPEHWDIQPDDLLLAASVATTSSASEATYVNNIDWESGGFVDYAWHSMWDYISVRLGYRVCDGSEHMAAIPSFSQSYSGRDTYSLMFHLRNARIARAAVSGSGSTTPGAFFNIAGLTEEYQGFTFQFTGHYADNLAFNGFMYYGLEAARGTAGGSTWRVGYSTPKINIAYPTTDRYYSAGPGIYRHINQSQYGGGGPGATISYQLETVARNPKRHHMAYLGNEVTLDTASQSGTINLPAGVKPGDEIVLVAGRVYTNSTGLVYYDFYNANPTSNGTGVYLRGSAEGGRIGGSGTDTVHVYTHSAIVPDPVPTSINFRWSSAHDPSYPNAAMTCFGVRKRYFRKYSRSWWWIEGKTDYSQSNTVDGTDYLSSDVTNGTTPAVTSGDAHGIMIAASAGLGPATDHLGFDAPFTEAVKFQGTSVTLDVAYYVPGATNDYTATWNKNAGTWSGVMLTSLHDTFGA